jgi:hypothetical protein
VHTCFHLSDTQYTANRIDCKTPIFAKYQEPVAYPLSYTITIEPPPHSLTYTDHSTIPFFDLATHPPPPHLSIGDSNVTNKINQISLSLISAVIIAVIMAITTLWNVLHCSSLPSEWKQQVPLKFWNLLTKLMASHPT